MGWRAFLVNMGRLPPLRQYRTLVRPDGRGRYRFAGWGWWRWRCAATLKKKSDEDVVAIMENPSEREEVRKRVYRENLESWIEPLEVQRNNRLCFGTGMFLLCIFLSCLVGAAIVMLSAELLGFGRYMPALAMGVFGVKICSECAFSRQRKGRNIPRLLEALGWNEVTYSSRSLMRKSRLRSVVPHGWFERVDGGDSLSEVRLAGRYTFCEASCSRLVWEGDLFWRRERISHGWILHVVLKRRRSLGLPMGVLKLGPEGVLQSGGTAVPPALAEPLRDLMGLAGVMEANVFPLARGIGITIVTERDLFEDIGNINEEFNSAKALRLIEEIDGVAGAAARLLDALAVDL